MQGSAGLATDASARAEYKPESGRRWPILTGCVDGRYSVGSTSDVVERERTHNEGSGAEYTAARRPVRLVYSFDADSVRVLEIRKNYRVPPSRCSFSQAAHLRSTSL